MPWRLFLTFSVGPHLFSYPEGLRWEWQMEKDTESRFLSFPCVSW